MFSLCKFVKVQASWFKYGDVRCQKIVRKTLPLTSTVN
jgi:hypothetical protein